MIFSFKNFHFLPFPSFWHISTLWICIPVLIVYFGEVLSLPFTDGGWKWQEDIKSYIIYKINREITKIAQFQLTWQCLLDFRHFKNNFFITTSWFHSLLKFFKPPIQRSSQFSTLPGTEDLFDWQMSSIKSFKALDFPQHSLTLQHALWR